MDGMLKITVPASSANLGPGFDSIGLAVNRHLVLRVTKAEEWLFTSKSKELANVPSGKDNLIYAVAAHVAELHKQTLPPRQVVMESDIPLARGLGSSAAAIVAGIELANQILHLQLSADEKVRIASLWEGHPDNVAPCVYGGLVVGYHSDERTDVVYCGVPEVDMVMLIPATELKTKDARNVLPETLEYKDAIRGSSIANVLVATVIQGKWDVAGEMMVRDLFHQPYRAALVPGLKEVMASIQADGGYGAALSGAGPSILCFAPIGTGKQLKEKLQSRYPDFEIEEIAPDANGIVVERL
ncbi:MAG TPA: homoserine kinase [Bacilli bacterium]|nr:homoserine kinase [Bacilli bacterium]